MSWPAIFSASASGLDRRGGSDVDRTAGHDLVGEAHRRHRQQLRRADGSPSRYCLLRITTVPIATRPRSSIAASKQLVRLLAGLAVGSQPVGALVVDRVDLVEGDEVGRPRSPSSRPGATQRSSSSLERDVVAFARARTPSRCRRRRPRGPTSRRPCDAGCEHRTSCRAGGSGRRDRALRCTPSPGRSPVRS